MADTPTKEATESLRAVPLAEARALVVGVVEHNYHGASDEIQATLAAAGIIGPVCPVCGETMVQADDHGRYVCRCNPGQHYQLGVWG